LFYSFMREAERDAPSDAKEIGLNASSNDGTNLIQSFRFRE